MTFFADLKFSLQHQHFLVDAITRPFKSVKMMTPHGSSTPPKDAHQRTNGSEKNPSNRYLGTSHNQESIFNPLQRHEQKRARRASASIADGGSPSKKIKDTPITVNNYKLLIKVHKDFNEAVRYDEDIPGAAPSHFSIKGRLESPIEAIQPGGNLKDDQYEEPSDGENEAFLREALYGSTKCGAGGTPAQVAKLLPNRNPGKGDEKQTSCSKSTGLSKSLVAPKSNSTCNLLGTPSTADCLTTLQCLRAPSATAATSESSHKYVLDDEINGVKASSPELWELLLHAVDEEDESHIFSNNLKRIMSDREDDDDDEEDVGPVRKKAMTDPTSGSIKPPTPQESVPLSGYQNRLDTFKDYLVASHHGSVTKNDDVNIDHREDAAGVTRSRQHEPPKNLKCVDGTAKDHLTLQEFEVLDSHDKNASQRIHNDIAALANSANNSNQRIHNDCESPAYHQEGIPGNNEDWDVAPAIRDANLEHSQHDDDEVPVNQEDNLDHNGNNDEVLAQVEDILENNDDGDVAPAIDGGNAEHNQHDDDEGPVNQEGNLDHNGNNDEVPVQASQNVAEAVQDDVAPPPQFSPLNGPPYHIEEDEKTDQDIISTRRGARQQAHHPGNARFLAIVRYHLPAYVLIPEGQNGRKRDFTNALLTDQIRGRFLIPMAGGGYNLMTFRKARVKVSQALRDELKALREALEQALPDAQDHAVI